MLWSVLESWVVWVRISVQQRVQQILWVLCRRQELTLTRVSGCTSVLEEVPSPWSLRSTHSTLVTTDSSPLVGRRRVWLLQWVSLVTVSSLQWLVTCSSTRLTSSTFPQTLIHPSIYLLHSQIPRIRLSLRRIKDKYTSKMTQSIQYSITIVMTFDKIRGRCNSNSCLCRHPLFPLLALLFEKCELATQSAECPSSDSFNVDIQAFVQHQQQEKRPLLAESEETNELVSPLLFNSYCSQYCLLSTSEALMYSMQFTFNISKFQQNSSLEYKLWLQNISLILNNIIRKIKMSC